jgi:hypothetical protein
MNVYLTGCTSHKRASHKRTLQAYISLDTHLMSVHLLGVHLIDVYVMGLHLIGVHLIGVVCLEAFGFFNLGVFGKRFLLYTPP